MAEILPYGAWRSPITSDLIVGGDDRARRRPGRRRRHLLDREAARARAAATCWCARSPDGGTRGRDPGAVQRPHPRPRIWRRQRDWCIAASCISPISPTSGFIGRRAGARAEAADPGRRRGEPARCVMPTASIDAQPQPLDRRARGARAPAAGSTTRCVAVDLGRGQGRDASWRRATISMPRRGCRRTASRLAWLTWNHPNMPWVGTELWVADIAADGGLAEPAARRRRRQRSRSSSRNGRPTACCISSPTAAAGGTSTAAMRRRRRGARALPARRRVRPARSGCSGSRPTPFSAPISSSAPITRPGAAVLARLDIAAGKLHSARSALHRFRLDPRCRRPHRLPRRLADRTRPRSSLIDPGDRRSEVLRSVGRRCRRRTAQRYFSVAAAHRVPDRERPDRATPITIRRPTRITPRPPARSRRWSSNAMAGRPVGLLDAQPRHPVLDQPRHRRARCRLRRQHRLRPRLSRAAERRAGASSMSRIASTPRATPIAEGLADPRARRHHRRQRRRLYRAGGACLARCVQGRRQLLRGQRCRGAGPRHPQIRSRAISTG